MTQQSILCIDSDLESVAEIELALKDHGVRVESIPEGDRAIEWALAHEPAMIVLAVEPRKVGYSICNKLRRLPTVREIPILLVSAGESPAALREHAKLRSRADAYLLKPLERSEVLKSVERLVGLKASLGDSVSTGVIELSDDEILQSESDDRDGLGEASVVGLGPEPPRGSEEQERPPTGLRERSPVVQTLRWGRAAPGAGLGAGGVVLAAAPSLVFDRMAEPPVSSSEDTKTDFAIRHGWAVGERPQGRAASSGAFGNAVESSGAGAGAEESIDILKLKPFWEEEDGDPVDFGEARTQFALPGGTTALALSPPPPPPDSAVAEPAPPVASSATGGVEQISAEETTPAPSWLEESTDTMDATTVAATLPSLARMTTEQIGEGAIVVHEAPAPAAGASTPGPSQSEPAQAALIAKDGAIRQLQERVDSLEAELDEKARREAELQADIGKLRVERSGLVALLDEGPRESREAPGEDVLQGLELREVINQREAVILDLRDALDGKELELLALRESAREGARAHSGLEQRVLVVERALFLAKERGANLEAELDRSLVRERVLKSHVDDTQEELRKARELAEELRARLVDEGDIARGHMERIEATLQKKLLESEEEHRKEIATLQESWRARQRAELEQQQGELDGAVASSQRQIEALQERAALDAVAAAARLQGELLKARQAHEGVVAAVREEHILQLESARRTHQARLDSMLDDHRAEVANLRQVLRDELAAAEGRRQNDIGVEEQRRAGELAEAEQRRRADLHAQADDHQLRVSELERRYLTERSEIEDRHRLEHDQVLARIVRVEGELIGKAQEIEQVNRRLAGMQGEIEVAHAELADRELKLAQHRDRVGGLQKQLTDCEARLERVTQRARVHQELVEEVQAALAGTLALISERISEQQDARLVEIARDEAART